MIHAIFCNLYFKVYPAGSQIYKEKLDVGGLVVDNSIKDNQNVRSGYNQKILERQYHVEENLFPVFVAYQPNRVGSNR